MTASIPLESLLQLPRQPARKSASRPASLRGDGACATDHCDEGSEEVCLVVLSLLDVALHLDGFEELSEVWGDRQERQPVRQDRPDERMLSGRSCDGQLLLTLTRWIPQFEIEQSLVFLQLTQHASLLCSELHDDGLDVVFLRILTHGFQSDLQLPAVDRAALRSDGHKSSVVNGQRSRVT